MTTLSPQNLARIPNLRLPEKKFPRSSPRPTNDRPGFRSWFRSGLAGPQVKHATPVGWYFSFRYCCYPTFLFFVNLFTWASKTGSQRRITFSPSSPFSCFRFYPSRSGFPEVTCFFSRSRLSIAASSMNLFFSPFQTVCSISVLRSIFQCGKEKGCCSLVALKFLLIKWINTSCNTIY